MAAAKKEASGDEDAKPEGGEGVDLPKKKVSGKKMALIIVAVLLLLGGGAGGAYFMGMFGGAPAEEAAAAAEAKAAEEAANAAPAYYEMPAIVVNLTSTGRRPAYVKVRVQLLLAKEEERPKIEENQPRIVDSFQTYLRELTMEELQGSGGLLRLREELLVRVNAAVAPAIVKDVLFQEILPQ